MIEQYINCALDYLFIPCVVWVCGNFLYSQGWRRGLKHGFDEAARTQDVAFKNTRELIEESLTFMQKTGIDPIDFRYQIKEKDD